MQPLLLLMAFLLLPGLEQVVTVPIPEGRTHLTKPPAVLTLCSAPISEPAVIPTKNTSLMPHRHSARRDGGLEERFSLRSFMGLRLSLTTRKVGCAFGGGCEATKHKLAKSLSPARIGQLRQTIHSTGVLVTQLKNQRKLLSVSHPSLLLGEKSRV